MAVAATESSVVKPSPGTPYQLDKTQATKACKILLKHMSDAREKKEASTTKRNLLTADVDSSDEEDASSPSSSTPIWLILTTKKHISDQKRLKPTKIALPHPFLAITPQLSICLITSDPQRLYKDAIASPAFPEVVRARIGRVIGLSKLKAKYKTFEARRQLAAEHELFLADDRIITYLPGVLGKTFYKATTKRPVPVRISGAGPRDEDGKRIKAERGPQGLKKDKDKQSEGLGVTSPSKLGEEIQKALDSALVHLAQSATTAIRVAAASFTPEQVTENISAVITGLLETREGKEGTLIPQGWRNVRAIHIKGPNTMAFPIWLASELWADDADVLAEKKPHGKKNKKDATAAITEEGETSTLAIGEEVGADSNDARKRKAGETTKPDAAKHAKKRRKAELEAAEAKARKDRMKKQKEMVMAEA